MRVLILVVLALSAAWSAPALAQGWTATVGARLRVKPPYEGAHDYVVVPIPTVVVRRADRPYRFVPPDGAATLGLIDTNWIVAGPVLRFRGRRSDDDRFAGLKRIGVATEPGVFIDLWPARWLRARVEARRGFGGHEGVVGDAGFDLVYMGPKWDASIGPRIGWGDAEYMQTYFGTTPAEAAIRTPGRPAYVPGGGRRYAGGAVAAAYHLTARWKINVDLTYQRLAPSALNSPVIRTVGSGDQLLAGLGVSYLFGRIR